MKRFSLIAIILIMMTAISALAAPKPSSATAPAFPGTLANARYVYVASYDRDQFDTNLLPEDRSAISSVQNAIQAWGKLTLVYQPSDADIIILVTSRPSEDLLAATDSKRARPRSSPNSKRDSTASKSTSKPARVLCGSQRTKPS
jgi:hypothetical protein